MDRKRIKAGRCSDCGIRIRDGLCQCPGVYGQRIAELEADLRKAIINALQGCGPDCHESDLCGSCREILKIKARLDASGQIDE